VREKEDQAAMSLFLLLLLLTTCSCSCTSIVPDALYPGQDLLSKDDAAGWLLVKHGERPLSGLMSAMCARKVKVADEPRVHVPKIHHSIFEEVPTSTRKRKSVKVFTYSFDELNPGLKRKDVATKAQAQALIRPRSDDESEKAVGGTAGAAKKGPSKRKGSTSGSGTEAKKRKSDVERSPTPEPEPSGAGGKQKISVSPNVQLNLSHPIAVTCTICHSTTSEGRIAQDETSTC
jgi:hypothetical protein